MIVRNSLMEIIRNKTESTGWREPFLGDDDRRGGLFTLVMSYFRMSKRMRRFSDRTAMRRKLGQDKLLEFIGNYRLRTRFNSVSVQELKKQNRKVAMVTDFLLYLMGYYDMVDCGSCLTAPISKVSSISAGDIYIPPTNWGDGSKLHAFRYRNIVAVCLVFSCT